MMTRQYWFLPNCLLLAAAMMQGGCANGDKLVYENYAQIRANSSTLAEVEAALGEPSNKLDDRWIYERPEKHLIVIVEFDPSGRVTRTQWIDAPSATWRDTADSR